MNFLATLFGIITYLVLIVWGLKLYNNHGKELGEYYKKIFSRWFKLPKWLNIVLIIIVFAGSGWLPFFVGLAIWIVLLFIVPAFYSLLGKYRWFSILQVFSFVFMISFIFSMFVLFNENRDYLGEKFIPGYSVYYTEELVDTGVAMVYENTDIVDVPHVEAESKKMEFFLKKVYPGIYQIFFWVIIILSLKLNLYVGRRMKGSKNTKK